MAASKQPTTVDRAVSHLVIAGFLALILKKPVGLLPALFVAACGVAVHEEMDAPLAGEIAKLTL